MAAVLDHYRLTDVTVVGESLGGGLVIRAAAFEPRISRVVSMDILDDEFEVIAGQIGRGVTPVLRALLAVRAKGIVNAVARRAIARKPVAAWGLQQGMHVTGTRRRTTSYARPPGTPPGASHNWSPLTSCCLRAPMTTTCR